MKIYDLEGKSDISCFSPLCDGKAIIYICFSENESNRYFCEECCRKIILKIQKCIGEKDPNKLVNPRRGV